MTLVYLLTAFASGAGVSLFYVRSKFESRLVLADERVLQLRSQLDRSNEARTTLENQQRSSDERIAVLTTTLENERQRAAEQRGNDDRLVAELERVSRTTLKETTNELVKTAEVAFKAVQQTAKGDLEQERLRVEHLVKPVQDNILKLEEHIAQSEKDRKEEYGGLFQQMQTLAETNRGVQAEAAQLNTVLRASSSQRGHWGEVQLRRVVDLAGMSQHCDFTEQMSVTGEEGRARADLVVHLPGEMKIAVDAKVPYGAYEKARTCDDATLQKQLFGEHAKAFRSHVDALAKRAYWDQYLPSCGFVVMFVPNESLLDAALSHDVTLWENAAEKRILLATPTTLISLLKMAAIGWTQQTQADNAMEITRVGKDLYKRLLKAHNHIEKVGRGLKTAVVSYNDFVGSMEHRVIPSAKKLGALSSTDDQIDLLAEITEAPKQLRAEVFKPMENSTESLVEMTAIESA